MSARQGSSEKELASESKEDTAKPPASDAKKDASKPLLSAGKKEADKEPPAVGKKEADKEPAAVGKKDADKEVAATKDSGKPVVAESEGDAEPVSAGGESDVEDDPKPVATEAKDDEPVVADVKDDKPVVAEVKDDDKPSVTAVKEDEKPIAASAKVAAKSAVGRQRTLGINLSAAAKFTSLVAIEWKDEGAWITEVVVDLEDDELVGYLSSGDRTGVYAPFGWPVAMVEAVASYTNGDEWQRASRRQFRHRQTESFVHDVLQGEADQELWPQSVSCDRLALQARRMAQLREQLFTETGTRFDRAGGDRILEVYTPGASLLWGLASHSENGLEIPPDASEKPGLLFIERIETAAPWLHWKEGKRGVCLKHEHTSDALLAALVARAAELNLTIGPENGDLDIARREGWMHLPSKDSLPALAG